MLERRCRPTPQGMGTGRWWSPRAQARILLFPAHLCALGFPPPPKTGHAPGCFVPGEPWAAPQASARSQPSLSPLGPAALVTGQAEAENSLQTLTLACPWVLLAGRPQLSWMEGPLAVITTLGGGGEPDH